MPKDHHRLKTHGGWAYTMLEPGSYLWRSPHGYTYLREKLRMEIRLLPELAPTLPLPIPNFGYIASPLPRSFALN